MRIGIYVGQAAVVRGYETMASGHIQVPLRSAALLRDAGHHVVLITTEIADGRVLPACTPAGLPVFEVIEPSGQGHRLEREGGRRRGLRPLRLLAWTRTMRAIAHRERLDLVHFFGAARTANLAGLFRLAGGRRALATMNVGGFPEPTFRLTRHLWHRLDRVLTTTEYFRAQLASHGIDSHVVRHGVVRDVRERGGGAPRRVLFWREATRRNGADVALEVFRRLAPRYPRVSFDFALRPHRDEVPGLDALAAEHDNVRVMRTPYPAGVTLESLLEESLCVLQPFEEYTIQPQLSILESMAAGVAVVAADIQSTRELIEDGRTGRVVPLGDIDAATAAVEGLVADPAAALAMGRAAAVRVARDWSWDGHAAALERHYAAALA